MDKSDLTGVRRSGQVPENPFLMVLVLVIKLPVVESAQTPGMGKG